MKAIVLCGGLGTRLGALTHDMPKPLLEVAGRPFLTYVLDQLVTAPIDEIILAVSYQWQKIQSMICEQWRGVKVSYSIEEEPLGTGGAIKQALTQFHLSEAIVVNGDTLLKCDTAALVQLARDRNADIGMALKMTSDTARFGKVKIDQSGHVTAFEEKGGCSQGLINAGAYFVKSSVFSLVDATQFSFENDILMQNLSNLNIYGMPTDAYFIDMGVPEDLSKAQNELGTITKMANV